MRPNRTHVPRIPPLRRLARWTVLAALPLGNAAALAYGPAPATAPSTAPASTRPTRPTTQPHFRVTAQEAVEFLASPELEGRYIGTPGIDKAADYAADAFAKLGLKPGGDDGDFFQSFKMLTSTVVDPRTTLAVAGARAALDKEFQPLSFSSEAKFDAPVVFVGYGIPANKDRPDYDDFANVDVKGKVVLAFRFEPSDEAGKSRFTPPTAEKGDWSDDAAIPAKAKAAADRGAVAMLLVNPPIHDEGDAISPFARRFQFDRSSIPVIQVKQPLAERLVEAGGLEDLKALQKKIDDANKPNSAPLKDVTVSGEVLFKRTEKQVQNVVAVLPGTNAEEYVVVGGHYDHLGRGGPGSLAPLSKDVHPGADDNASGTAAVLDIAEQFAHAARAGNPPARTLVFALFTGEEEGLVGSKHFVNKPPVPLDKVVAMVNLDMVGRLKDDKLTIGGTGTAPSFDRIVKAAAEGTSLKLSTGSKGGMGPSDHTSFATKRIPVLFFFTGVHRDYHRPTDTPDKVNYAGLATITEVAVKVVDAIARLPREQYVATHDSSGFGGMGSGKGSASGGAKATLGVVPDYGGEEEGPKGVSISGTGPGSPAEKAGLKGGDVIVQFGETKVDNLQDLFTALSKSKPGDKVKLVLLRNGARVETEATLAERKG